MSILHTVNSRAALGECRAALARDDRLLLIEDAVYCAAETQLLADAAFAGVTLFALQEDVAERGLAGRIPSLVSLVSMVEFVRLACATDKTISWF